MQLAANAAAVKSPISLEPQAYRDPTDLIEQLLEIGAALSDTNDLGELLHLILFKSREITWSDAGSVFLVDRQQEQPCLWFKATQNASCPGLSFHESMLPLTPESLVGYVALTGKTLNLADAYQLPPGVPYQLNRDFDQRNHYRTRSVLLLPMQNREGDIIGVLQLINRKQSPDLLVTPENVNQVTQPYSEQEERILRSLASQAAISIERNQLEESIEQLFEGFVRASVQVIEARDPCTSGHSERVAELTVRLGLEINTVNAGPLQSFCFNDRQIQEIRYAALLHDFGKVGVPEAILNKQKKLFPDQLSMIRQRFSLVQRTLQLECAQAKFRYLLEHPHARHPDDQDCVHCHHFNDLEQHLQQAIAQLDQYWELLLEANEPRVLAEEPLAQLQALAAYTYRDIDGEIKPLITPAELEQLLVKRGNLTAAEWLAMQSHVTHTYEFLKRIPWTRQLQDVPLIAYGHHERLNGTGYPQGLEQSQIPFQAQMMAVADIYDALTARDRPYKRSLPVARALEILRQEAANHHVNADLVMLFEQRQIFTILGHTL